MTEPTLNLILAYRPKRLDPEDFERIGRRVMERAPDTEVFVVNSETLAAATRRRAARRPTLIVSPTRLVRFRPERGKVYQGGAIGKTEQLSRLADAGIPVPKSALLEPDTRLDPAEWGDIVILKPTAPGTFSHGQGIGIMRTARVRYRPPADYPPDHPGSKGPILVQQFIDTGPHPWIVRVLTLFGEPLYSMRIQLRQQRPALDASDTEIENAQIATNGGPRERILETDPAVIALARRVYEAIPERPVHGCDIVCDAETGALSVLEINCGGNVWHFSSATAAEWRDTIGGAVQMFDQYGAIDVAASVLIEKTRAEAE